LDERRSVLAYWAPGCESNAPRRGTEPGDVLPRRDDAGLVAAHIATSVLDIARIGQRVGSYATSSTAARCHRTESRGIADRHYSEERFRVQAELFDQAMVALITGDATGIVTRWNRFASGL